MRNTREKLDLLLEYQNVPEEKKGECLRQTGLHTELFPAARQRRQSLYRVIFQERKVYMRLSFMLPDNPRFTQMVRRFYRLVQQQSYAFRSSVCDSGPEKKRPVYFHFFRKKQNY